MILVNYVNTTDTALNVIRLYCVDRSKDSSSSRDYTSIDSNVGGWGDWGIIQWCSSGYLTSFQLKVESSQGSGDDTAANNIKFKCSGGDVLEGSRPIWSQWGDWGDWSDWSPTCEGKGICGIKTLVEGWQRSGDDTALNDGHMFCCD
ncbi:hypothetical protein R3I94_022521 [Phoxinus phoxinus]|uniref:Uncharacterized protein n=1 Tax=Phoxinus phoxinus TaxID=58324 RepID=A0AAN9GT64_9TELE